MKIAKIAAAAALCIAVPVMAQSSSAPASGEQYSPQDDLRCAMFSSALLGSLGDDPAQANQRSGILGGLMYFVGRWEAAEGGDLGDAMRKGYPAFQRADQGQVAQECSMRMMKIGGDLQKAGQALIELEAQQQDGTAPAQ